MKGGERYLVVALGSRIIESVLCGIIGEYPQDILVCFQIFFPIKLSLKVNIPTYCKEYSENILGGIFWLEYSENILILSLPAGLPQNTHYHNEYWLK